MPPYALLFVYSILFLSLLNPLKVRFLREDFSSTHMHLHLYDLKNCLPHEFWMFKSFFSGSRLDRPATIISDLSPIQELNFDTF